MELKLEMPSSDILVPKPDQVSPLKGGEQRNSRLGTEHASANLSDSASSQKPLAEAYELLNKCKEVYTSHKLDEAYKYLQQLRALQGSFSKEIVPAFLELLSKEKVFIHTLEQQYVYLKKVVGELESVEGWKCDQIDSNVKIHYRRAPNDLWTIKMEAEVDVPVLHLLSMINEVELWKLWNAFMNKTAEVKTINRAAKVYYVEYGLPYPLSNREIYLYGYGVNRLHENGTVVICAQSVDNDLEFFKEHEIKKIDHSGTVNIEIYVGGFEITPIGRDKCILKGIANLNPKFNWIPRNVLNWVIRLGTKQMVEKIIHGAKHFKGSPWEKEIQSERKKDFYEWLQQQLEEYHVKKDISGEELKASA